MKYAWLYILLSFVPGILFFHCNGRFTTTAIFEAVIFIGLCPLLTLIGIGCAVKIPKARILYILGAILSAFPGIYLLAFVAHWGHHN